MGAAQSACPQPLDPQEMSDPWWGASETQAEAQGRRDASPGLGAVLRRVEDLGEELRQDRQELLHALRQGESAGAARGDAEASQSTAGRRRELELAMLRAQLSLQREARHRKLEQVSAEMERLRGELGAERERALRLQQQPAWEALVVESEQLREDLHRERMAREDLQKQRDGLQEHNKRLLEALSEAEGSARVEKDAADLLRAEGARLESIVKDVGEELSRCREEAAAAVQEREEIMQQVAALKEVAAISKRMLAIREDQVRDMKEKLTAIEDRIGAQHSSTTVASLRTEYEKQIKNIRDLKQLYEERARVLQEENHKQAQELDRKAKDLDDMQGTVKELEEKATKLEASLSERGDALEELEFQLGDSVAECQSLTVQMKRINSLFTEMLLGPATSSDIDLDRLSRLLHENHDLITDITVKGGGSDIAPVLPKLILDLLTQVENEHAKESRRDGEQEAEQAPQQQEVVSGEHEQEVVHSDREELVKEITSNLPKVWAVLRELVSQQAGRGVRRGSVGDSEKGRSSCYTNVNTPGGPRKVISVSKTYIRLKDLILEKRALQRELGRLKQLNGHLETRLDEQESRLSQVSSELHKTWGLVGRLQAQHQQLHTHEKILRYELHQKRELLSELKQELEYCREKWESARQKNSQTDHEWRLLRREFAARKARDASHLDFLNNSGESGLGEESGDDDIDSSGRSESPSVAEDTETSPPSPSLIGANSSEDDLPADSAPSIQVSLAPLLEDTIEHEGELQSLELTPVQVVTSSALVVEPLAATVVSSAAVVLETEVVPSAPSQRGQLTESEDVSEHSDIAESPDLTDLKARALVAYAQRVATLRTEERREDSAPEVRDEEEITSVGDEEDSFHPGKDEDAPCASKDDDVPMEEVGADRIISTEHDDNYASGCTDVNNAPETGVTEKIAAEGGGERTPAKCVGAESTAHVTEELLDIGFETPPRPRVIPLFGAIPQPQEGTPTTPLLFSAFDIQSMDFSDVSSFLTSAALAPPPPPPPPPPPVRPPRSPEDILASRAARLQRMEEQADWLRRKWARTNERGSALSSKLDEIHDQYGPSSSSSSSSPSPPPPSAVSASRSSEEILASRAERLRRLEEQCNSLFNQVSRTSHISNVLSSRLEELHDHYGASAPTSTPALCDSPPLPPPPPPPPLPEMLPTFRIPLSSSDPPDTEEEQKP